MAVNFVTHLYPANISWYLRLLRRKKEKISSNCTVAKNWRSFLQTRVIQLKPMPWLHWKIKSVNDLCKKGQKSGILASLNEAPAFFLRRLSAFVGQVSQTMGNCLKSPTADDVSLLREGGNNSNSAEQLEQQPYNQVIPKYSKILF